MSYVFDDDGFPYLQLPNLKLSMALLPVTKVQFERYLSDAHTPESDHRYKEILDLNPRISLSRCCSETQERLFLTGITSEELLALAQWLRQGSGLRIRTLTVVEWRKVYQQIASLPLEKITCHIDKLAPLPNRLFKHIHKRLNPPTALDFCFLRSGIMEWVQDDQNTWVHLGAPRPQFLKNLWNPLHEVIFHADSRLCGGRFVIDMS